MVCFTVLHLYTTASLKVQPVVLSIAITSTNALPMLCFICKLCCLNTYILCLPLSLQTLALFKTAYYTSSMHWLGQNLACSMHTRVKSAVWQKYVDVTPVWLKCPVCIRPVSHLLRPTVQNAGAITIISQQQVFFFITCNSLLEIFEEGNQLCRFQISLMKTDDNFKKRA